MIEILKWSLFLTISIVLSLILFGFLIRAIQRKSNTYIYNTFGKSGLVCYGIIGTSIHEFGHFIMAKLFLHKIVDVKWFSLNINNSGELGHVTHSYNKKNIYQRIGNFFIGTAPLIIGSIILIFFYWLFLRNSFEIILNHLNLDNFLNLGTSFSPIIFIKLLINKFMFIIETTFTVSNFESISFWIFLFISISISTHMSLSSADLKNAIDGILFIFIASLVFSGIFYFLSIPFSTLNFYIISFNIFLISFLCIGLFFSLLSLIISYILFKIKRFFIK